MSHSVQAVRGQFTMWRLTQTALALGVLWFLLDPSPAQFAVTTLSTLVLGVTNALQDAYDLRESATNASFGVVALLSGSGMAAFDPAGGLALPVTFLLIGTWFVADGVQTLRHEGATRDRPDGHDVYQQYVRRRVDRTLAERSRTRRELIEALDADADRVSTAVETLRDRGVVTQVGSELRVDRDDPGTLDRLRATARRLARPLTLELDEPESERAGGSTPRHRPDETGGRQRDTESRHRDEREPELE